MNELVTVVLTIVGTVIAYLFARWLYKRVYTPFLLPITVATTLIILSLVIFRIPYETYMSGAKYVQFLTGPAVVSLAFPLYQQRDILKKYTMPLLVGIFGGSVTGIVSGGLIAKLVGFSDELIYSLVPKSVTTPVAMDISNSFGGIDALAAVFVMVAGIAGAMLSTYTYRYLKIDHPISRGVGLGAASHAVGTTKALEHSQLEGSVSTIAMIVSAVFTSLTVSILVRMFM